MALPTTDQTETTEVPATGIPSSMDLMQKQNQALSQLVESLNTRQNPNYFSIAGALLNPGRTGSAGEAVGNAATEMGRQQEQREQQAPSIAMLKAQLLGQQYNMGLKQQGMKMLAGMFDGQVLPQEAAQKLESGSMPASFYSKLTPNNVAALYAVSPEYGKAAEAGAKLYQEQRGNDIKQLELGSNLFEKTRGMSPEDREAFATSVSPYANKLGISLPSSTAKAASPQPPGDIEKPPQAVFPVANGQISSGYGQRIDPFDPNKVENHESIDIKAREGDPVMAAFPGKVVKTVPESKSGGYGNQVVLQHPDGTMSMYSHLKNFDVSEGDIVRQGAPIGSVGNTGRSTGPHLDFRMLSNDGKPMDPTGLFNQPSSVQAQPPSNQPQSQQPRAGLIQRSDESKSAFEKRKELIESQSTKDYNEMASGLIKTNVDTLRTSIADLNELKSYAKYTRRDGTNPIFAPLQKRDIDSYVTAANKAVIQILKSGGNLNVNGVHAAIGFNLEPVYQNLKLSDEEKNMSARAANIISTQIINNIIANKTAAFGGSRVTNYQDQQLSALNANMDQLPQYILGWATRRQVDNAHSLDVANEYNNYVRQSYDQNKIPDPKGFFTSDLYREVLPNRHTTKMNEALEKYPYK